MQTYTAHDLVLAIKLIKEEGLSIRKEAKHGGIPQSTLTDRMNSYGCKPRQKSSLQFEELIVQQTRSFI